jgi:phosphohistidine phosphatase
MDIYIIRHAWAGQYGDIQWPDDPKRPLTQNGRKRFAKIAELLVKRGMTPTLIASSPMTRCIETASIISDTIGEIKIVELPELLPQGNLQNLLAWLVDQSERYTQIALVGHSPEVGQITAALMGRPESSVHYAKGAISCIRFQGPIESSGGELRWLITPKLMGI